MIYLIRHMQSEANLKRIWGGNYPLTEKGIQDAKSTKEKITFQPDILVASPLIRAQETAKILFPEMKIHTDDTFREIYFGDHEDVPMLDDEFKKIYQNEPSRLHQICNGDDIKARADKAILALLNYLPSGTVAVVCHDTLIRGIICRLKGEHLDNMPQYKPLLPNGSILQINFPVDMKIL